MTAGLGEAVAALILPNPALAERAIDVVIDGLRAAR